MTKIRTVEEVTELIDSAISVTDLNYMSSVSEEKVIAILTKDRLAISTALVEALEAIKQGLEKLEKEHHEQFLVDERRYKFDPSANNLQVMKLHEGSTSAYAGGIRMGKIEALTEAQNIIKNLLHE